MNRTYHVDPEKRIEYRYLNMDLRKFQSRQELDEYIRGRAGLWRAISSWEHDQVLICWGSKQYDEGAALFWAAELNRGVANA